MPSNPLHTAGNAVPSLDDTDLGGLLDDLRGIHPGFDLICDGAQLLATDRLTTDQTQTIVAAAAGGADGTNTINLFGQLIARLSNPDTNPCLRELPFHQQRLIRLRGEVTAFVLSNPRIAQFASDTSAAITEGTTTR